MTLYPLVFKAESESLAGIQTPWVSRASEQQGAEATGDLKCAIPPEFEGPGAGSSPEDFFVLALLNCYIATLKVVAEKSKLSFEMLNGSASLTLDKNEAGTPSVKSVNLSFTVSGVLNEDRFTRMMERVSKQCMMINAVKCAVTFEFVVRAVDA